MNYAGTPHVTSFAFDVPEHAIDTKAVMAVRMIVRYFFIYLMMAHCEWRILIEPFCSSLQRYGKISFQLQT